MRQNDKTYQQIFEHLKESRINCLKIIYLVSVKDLGNLEDTFRNNRLHRALEDVHSQAQRARFNLGIVLEEMDNSGQDPYARWKNVFEIRDEIEVEEESDYPPTFPLPSGPTHEIFMGLASDIESLEGDLKKMALDLSEYILEGWLYRHLEDAVVELTQCRCNLRLISAILSDEKGYTKDQGGSESSTNSVLSTDQGFQASGRAGRY